MSTTVSQKYKKGFTALLSSLIISAVLVGILSAVSFESQIQILTLLQNADKITTRNSAWGCMNVAIALLSDNPDTNLPTPLSLFISTPTCTILSLYRQGNQITVQTESHIQNIKTLLDAVVMISNQTIISVSSWEET